MNRELENQIVVTWLMKLGVTFLLLIIALVKAIKHNFKTKDHE